MRTSGNEKESIFKAEIDEINKKVNKTKEVWCTAHIHTTKESIPVSLLISVDTKRDYVKDVGDHIFVHMRIPKGLYFRRIMNHRANLEITLKKKSGDKVWEQRLKLAISSSVRGLKGSRHETISENKLDSEGFVDVTGQCVNRFLEVMVGQIVKAGTYNGVNFKKLVPVIFKEVTDEITVSGMDNKVTVVMEEPSNNRNYKNLVLKTGIKIMDLPSFLQNKDFGLYNGNVYTFLQMEGKEKKVYIGSLHNTEVKNKRQLKVLLVPETKYANYSNTYTSDDTTLKIITSSSDSVYDNIANLIMNKGQGIHVPETDGIAKRSLADDGGTPTVNKCALATRVVNKETPDNTVKLEYSKPTNNLYKARSSVMERNGMNVMVRWEYSNSDLIFPGMIAYLMYENGNGKAEIIKGVVHGTQESINNNKKTAISMINLYLEGTSRK